MPLETPDTGSTEEQNRLLPATLEDRLVRLIGRAGGLALVALLGILWVTLLSWSVNDPSLTFATGGRTQNLLGPLGAIVSDLLLQMLGLSAAVALLAPMFWAIELTASERVPGFRTKASFYPLSVIVLAGALSTLPVPASWPLHHALGGILGDVVAGVGAMLFGAINPERAYLATGLVLFATGLTTLLYSIGLETRDLAKLVDLAPGPEADQAASQAVDQAPAASRLERFWSSVTGKKEHKGEPTLPGLEPAQQAQHQHDYGYAQTGGDGWVADPQAFAAYAQAYGHPQQQPAGYYAAYPPHAYAPAPAPAPAAAPVAHHPHGAPEPQAWPAHYDPVYGAMPQQAGYAPLPRDGFSAPPQFHPAPRDIGFDVDTDMASRNIAERFAPASREGRPARDAAPTPTAPAAQPHAPQPEPQQPRSEPVEPQPQQQPGRAAAKPGSGFLSGLAFRRAEPAYKRPSLNLLKRPAPTRTAPELTQTALRGSARLLEDTLADFGVKAEVREIKPGPVVTLFEVEPARGTKSARIIGLADDIARSMSAASVRVAVVPGRNAIGIELPNARRDTVFLREILEAEPFKSGESVLPVALGKGIGGETIVADLARMPHLLVAGTTGSGKSVGVNAMILSLLYRHSPDECRMIMIDPKMLELSVYNGIPHLLTPVVTDPQKAVAALNWAVSEMEERYKRMARLNVRNIDVYNNRVRNAKKRGELTRTVQTGFDRKGEAVYENQDMDLETMPYIVVVVDEFADLMIVAGKEIEGAVQRLAQMARAAGIHLIMATQRPSVDIITGTIKANFPTRISFKVTSKIDSRTILNDQGAEQLLGQGDMLYSTGAGQVSRVHGPFVSDEEVESIAAFLRAQGEPKYVTGITEAPEQPSAGAADGQGRAMSEDDLYDRAVAIVLRDRKPSTSYIQRRLSIGYNRAADLIERMEREGIVSPASGSGKREILAAEPGSNAA